MKPNMGTADKVIRIMIAVIIAGLYFANILSGTIALILLALAGVFILTSFVGFCPIYWLLGITTCKKHKR